MQADKPWTNFKKRCSVIHTQRHWLCQIKLFSKKCFFFQFFPLKSTFHKSKPIKITGIISINSQPVANDHALQFCPNFIFLKEFRPIFWDFMGEFFLWLFITRAFHKRKGKKGKTKAFFQQFYRELFWIYKTPANTQFSWSLWVIERIKGENLQTLKYFSSRFIGGLFRSAVP